MKMALRVALTVGILGAVAILGLNGLYSTAKGQVISQEPPATLVSPWATVALTEVASGFRQPTYVTHAGDGSGRLFVVEKVGRIWVVQNGRVLPEPFLDITDRVRSRESERGLLSVAFHPNYKKNGRFFVNYTDQQGNTVVAEYRVTADPNRADPQSERVLLYIEQPAANHNGGQLQFGPDGYLYIGMGDGGAAGDPWGNAQNLGVLLGKMLRIDVDHGDPYGIPPDNPFVDRPGARPEIWSYGLRNPWRFSFDRLTGDLYIADVGQNKWEEVDVVRAPDPGGQNFGWDIMEGFHCFEPPVGCNTQGLTMPVVEYGHDQGCSIIGGYVYRGRRFADIQGTYFFSDFCTGRMWGLRYVDGAWQWAVFLDTGLNVSSFGEDEAGEVYVVDYRGTIYRLEGKVPLTAPQPSPTATPSPTPSPTPTSTRTPTPSPVPSPTATLPKGTPTRGSGPPTPAEKGTATPTATPTPTATTAGPAPTPVEPAAGGSPGVGWAVWLIVAAIAVGLVLVVLVRGRR